jgi:predicted SprT family Zn-dependent metalloprotease
VSETLARYIPEHAVKPVFELIVVNQVHLKIVNERQTRHGDYRKGVNGKHEITVNSNLNKYKFLITLIHEISHLVAFEKFGRNIKPHGNEWKYSFQRLMILIYAQKFSKSAATFWQDISKPNGQQ